MDFPRSSFIASIYLCNNEISNSLSYIISSNSFKKLTMHFYNLINIHKKLRYEIHANTEINNINHRDWLNWINKDRIFCANQINNNYFSFKLILSNILLISSIDYPWLLWDHLFLDYNVTTTHIYFIENCLFLDQALIMELFHQFLIFYSIV